MIKYSNAEYCEKFSHFTVIVFFCIFAITTLLKSENKTKKNFFNAKNFTRGNIFKGISPKESRDDDFDFDMN